MRLLLVILLASCFGCSEAIMSDGRSATGFGSKGDKNSNNRKGGDGGKSGNGNEGIGGFLDDPLMARNRCEFVELSKSDYDVTCRLVVAGANGTERIVAEVSDDIDVSFEDPTLERGDASIQGCKIDGFSQTCRIADVTTIAQILFALKVRSHSTNEEAVEEERVLLPFSVKNALGYVLSASEDFQLSEINEGLSLSQEDMEAKFGLQRQPAKNLKAPISGGPICANKLGLFLSSGPYLFRSRDGLIRRFAGSPFRAAGDSGHRSRLFIDDPTFWTGGGYQILCEDESVLIHTSDNKIYRVDESPFFHLAFDLDELGIRSFRSFRKTKSGDTLFRMYGGVERIDKDGIVSTVWSREDFGDGMNYKIVAFEVSPDGSKALIQLGNGDVRVYRADTFDFLFNLDVSGARIRYVLDDRIVYTAADKFYYRNFNDLDTEHVWRPALDLDDLLEATVPSSAFRAGGYQLMGVFTDGKRFYLSTKSTIYELTESAFVRAVGESLDETTNAQEVVVDRITSLAFQSGTQDLYFTGSNTDIISHNIAMGRLDPITDEIKYIHGSFSQNDRKILGENAEDIKVDIVGEDGAIYGRRSKIVNSVTVKTAFSLKDGVVTDLAEVDTQKYLTPVVLNEQGQAVFGVVFYNNESNKYNVEVTTVTSAKQTEINLIEFGISGTHPDFPILNPYLNRFFISKDLTVYFVFQLESVAYHGIGRFTLANGSYGDMEVIAGSGDKVSNSQDITKVPWNRIKFAEVEEIKLDQSGNIYVLTPIKLLRMQRSDKTVTTIFGEQKPKDCATGVISGLVENADNLDALLRTGFGAFCPGSSVSAFNVIDGCSSVGSFKVAIGIKQPIGSSNVLLAERTCQ